MSRQSLQIQLVIRGERGYSRSFLPVSIVDARGQVLSTGTVTSRRPTELGYERGDNPVFVRLNLPNGTTETRPLLTGDRIWHDEVTFRVGDDVATSDWMAWSAARLDVKRQGGALLNQPGMEDAWFQLWEKTPDAVRWRQVPIELRLRELHRSREAIQLELGYSQYPRALVVRLDSDSPQIVSLPIFETSVLVMMLRTLSGRVKPRVVVGGYSPNAEAIMEFLRAGRLGSVETLLDPGSELAHRLLHLKVEDPIAATAAAYYLLRKRDWDRLPPLWLDNLAHWYEGIPDAQLIRAASRIERGMPIGDAANLAVETLSHFLDRGIPLFAEATWLLSDLLALAEKAEEPLDARMAKSLRKMLASSRPSGLSFGFAGNAPDRPMAAHDAFEQRQGTQSGQLLAEAVRQIRDLSVLRPALLPSPLDLEPASRQLRVAVDALRTGVDVLLSTPRRSVPGSAAKTLFLREVLGEEKRDAQ